MEKELNNDRTSTRPAYHEMMAILGVGDLHPGGKPATEFLLSELAKTNPRTVLEIGAGAGWTTARMIKRGWRVTPIEPSAVLCDRLEARCRVPAHRGSFESFAEEGAPYDAVIGEGVIYGLDPSNTVAKIGRLLRPGGVLAFTDMVWTESAQSDIAGFIHDQTKRAFGIPMAPRNVVAWSDWNSSLRDAGFSELVTRKVDPAAFDPDRRARRARVALGLLSHPGLLPLYLTYRSYLGINWAPPGWLQAWIAVWKFGVG
jgi:SAM-dependent methyltransferase